MSEGFYDWLLFLHIFGAMVWVGGGVLLGAMVTRVLRRGEPGAVADFIANLRVIGPLVLAPATVAVVGFGVWLALAFFAIALVIGAGYQGRAAINADRAAGRGDHDEARRQLARWSWGYRLIVLLLIAATWDMVFKPGL
jgi:uncharacterized membrane protein